MKQDVFLTPNEAEIIIGDDGSEDGSLETIEAPKREYPEIIKSFVMRRDNIDIIPSIRASNVLRKGFELSCGKYIQVLSADDILLEENKVSSAISFLSQNGDYSCCYTNYKMFWDDGSEKYPDNKGNQFSRPILWSYEYRHISCYLFRRIVISNLLN